MNNLLIKKPIISEKSFGLAAKGVYSFIVDKRSDKKQLAVEVKEVFKVDAVSVNIINIPGKVKRNKKGYGKRSDIKKALIKIKDGQKIAIFEIEDEQKTNNNSKKPVKTEKTKKIKKEEIK